MVSEEAMNEILDDMSHLEDDFDPDECPECGAEMGMNLGMCVVCGYIDED